MMNTVNGMNLIGMAAGPAASGNTAYNAAQARAQEARFEDMLRELRQKAEMAEKPAASENVPSGGVSPAGSAAVDPAAAEDKARTQLRKRLKDACEGFEAMLLGIMYKEMRNTVPKNQLFGDDNAHDIWQSMLDSAMMEEAAKTGGIGFARVLYQQLEPQVLAEKSALPGASVTEKP